jgi:hypothetical protein
MPTNDFHSRLLFMQQELLNALIQGPDTVLVFFKAWSSLLQEFNTARSEVGQTGDPAAIHTTISFVYLLCSSFLEIELSQKYVVEKLYQEGPLASVKTGT